MRLTLRTLLAYVDDILDPDDAQDLARKIEESEFAGALLERRRDLLRKLRLGAPEPLGGSTGLDPNTVAEYLDNTLPPEHVADVERVCLESDVHLAEVSACHQVLTLVLGSPAEVEPACRRRLYGVGQPQAAEHAGTQPPRADETAAPRPGELPDYLRPRRRASGWVALVSLAGAGFALWCSPASRQVAWHWIQQAVTVRPAVPAVDRTRDSEPPATDPVPAFSTHASEPTLASDANPQAELLASDSALHSAQDTDQLAPGPSLNDAPPGASGEDPTGTPAAAEHQTPAATPQSSALAEGAAWETPGDEAGGSPPNPDSASAGTIEPAPPVVGSQEPSSDRDLASGSPTLTWPGEPALPTETGTEPPAPEPAETAVVESQPAEGAPPVAEAGPAPPGEIASSASISGAGAESTERSTPVVPASYSPPRLASETASLWRLDPADGQWRPLAAGEALSAGNRLAGWPLSRPQLELGSGLTVELVGGARLALAPPPTAGLPGLELEEGRLVARFLGPAGQTLELQSGAVALAVSAPGPAALALETACAAKTDRASTDELVRSFQLHVLEGSLEWRVGTASPTTTAAPAVIRVLSDGTASAEPSAAAPSWVLPRPASASDERASAELRSSLESGQTATTALRKLALSKQPAVRRAAIEGLTALDEFAPAAAALADPGEKVFWPTAAALLQSGIARGQESGQRVRTALRQAYASATADELYRLLCGATLKELETGLARQLAADLDHEELAVRVLAFWNLRQLSRATYGYQPEQTAAKRRQAVQRWQKQLAAGRIAVRPSAQRN
jgi:hypothetical protein